MNDRSCTVRARTHTEATGEFRTKPQVVAGPTAVGAAGVFRVSHG